MTIESQEAGQTIECSQQNCNEEAIFRYVWNEYKYACAEHMLKTIQIANAMGFPTPERTMELLPAPTENPDFAIPDMGEGEL